MTAIDNRIPTATFTLAIGGMACAACAARVTKRLNKLDGVEANVNYATEQATAVTSSGVSVDALIAAIESLGYTATNVDDGHATFADDPPEAVDDTRIRNLRDRLIGTTVLTVPPGRPCGCHTPRPCSERSQGPQADQPCRDHPHRI